MRHATGLICPAESDHPDQRSPKPLSSRRPPRNFSTLDPTFRASSGPSPALLLSAVDVQYRGGPKSRKCRCLFGLRDSDVQKMWTEKPLKNSELDALSTRCGICGMLESRLVPHGARWFVSAPLGWPAYRSLGGDLFVHIRLALPGGCKEHPGRARGEPAGQQVVGSSSIGLLKQPSKPALHVAQLRRPL